MRKTALLIFFLLIAVSGRGQEPAPTTSLALPDGKTLRVEIARTPVEQARGLMFRATLPEDHGMLFIFDRTEAHRFWMKNTLIPLDIVWMDQRKRIIHIEYQVPPCKRDPCPVYGPSAESLYVLEVNAGVAQKGGLRIGTALPF
ncbi:MAG: DUF192 domain-containing protein [Nitrospirae bacterium]|nr:DUF192 domain-containing protein [Nitrospirota bacterium]